jgi:pSer/pThr/pTyr-binding forkhead associated (FHA) protein
VAGFKDKATGRFTEVMLIRTSDDEQKFKEAYHIEATEAVIGRERTPGAIVLHDPNVSRRHAELMWADGGWYIRDLGSTNGTIVNNVEVDSRMLAEGDVLTISITNLEFRAG